MCFLTTASAGSADPGRGSARRRGGRSWGEWKSAHPGGSRREVSSQLLSWRVPGFPARYGWRVFLIWAPDTRAREQGFETLLHRYPTLGVGSRVATASRLGSGDALSPSPRWASRCPDPPPGSPATGSLGTRGHAQISGVEFGDHEGREDFPEPASPDPPSFYP